MINSDMEASDDGDDHETQQLAESEKRRKNRIQQLRERFDSYLKELSVIGFNSAKYDLNVIKRSFF